MTFYYGEIVAAYPPDHNSNTYKRAWEYAVKVLLKAGTPMVFQRAIRLETFGGVLDFHHIILQASGDQSTSAYNPMVKEDESHLTLGARVAVCFLNDDQTFPVIVGCIPHPLTPVEDATTIAPPGKPKASVEGLYQKMHSRFNGVDFLIDELGQYSVTHYGLTKVKQEKPFSEITFTEPDPLYTTGFQFGEKGEFFLGDAVGQFLQMDPVNENITISNAAAGVIFDQKNEILDLFSTGNVYEKAGKDWNRYVQKNMFIKNPYSGCTLTENGDWQFYTPTLTFDMKSSGDLKFDNKTATITITPAGDIEFDNPGANIKATALGEIKVVNKIGQQFIELDMTGGGTVQALGGLKLIGSGGQLVL